MCRSAAIDHLIRRNINQFSLPLVSTLAPGLADWQAAHCWSSALFETMQTSQSQLPSGFLNLSPNPNRGAILAGVDVRAWDDGACVEGAAAAPVYFNREQLDRSEVSCPMLKEALYVVVILNNGFYACSDHL